MNISVWPWAKKQHNEIAVYNFPVLATGAPDITSIQTQLTACPTQGALAALVTSWFGVPYGFQAPPVVAVALARFAPFISFELAQTLEACSSQSWWEMLDAKRVSKQYLDQQRKQSIGALNRFIAVDNKETTSDMPEAKRLEQARIRIKYLVQNPTTEDKDLANLVACINRYIPEADRPWTTLANHPNAEQQTYITMATYADLQAAKALAHQPKAIQWLAVAAVLRYHGDSHPEFLLAFARAKKGVNQAIKDSLQRQWSWLVKNKTEELLGIRDNFSKEFLSNLSKEALGAMLTHPDKAMREWGALAVGTHAALRSQAPEAPSVVAPSASVTKTIR